MINLEEVTFSHITEYGSIGIIGLGRDISSQLEKIDFIASDKIIVFDSHEINYKQIKQLCDTSDVIFITGNLDDISVVKCVLDLVSYLKSLDTNSIAVIKNGNASLELAEKIKKYISFVDLEKQENNTLLWTLESLHRIIYYYNDQYNFKDANYPVNMFWETFFHTTSEIFLYQSDSLSTMLEKMKMNAFLSKQLKISKYCLLNKSNTAIGEIETLMDSIEEDLDEDAYFYIKNEKFNSKFNDLIMFIGV